MQRKIITKRIVSPQDNVIAEVMSEVMTSDDENGSVQQSIDGQVSSDGTRIRVSAYSRASSGTNAQATSYSRVFSHQNSHLSDNANFKDANSD